MPKTLTQVTRDAAELSAAERLKLVRILLDLSEADTDAHEEVEAAWEREIQRRLQELESGKVKGVPLEEIKRRLEADFQA